MQPENDTDADNRLDLQILQRQLSNASSSIDSTVSEERNVWPLYLSTTFLDHYIFGELIGNGSYAEVRECIETRTLRRCAVKIVNKEYLKRQGPNALLNQKQEIRLLKQINHPNIITLFECIYKGPKIYIFLEYCTFVLHNVLNEQIDNKLSPPLARYLFHQLITGVNYLHSIGIVHRDIKPQNLLISNSGQLKIIDLGVCQVLSMWTQRDTSFNHEGSPLFQAPEVVSGQHEYGGFKVDVWSAGVTLYLMLFGSYPFEDESLLGLYDKILSDDYTQAATSIPQQLVVDDLVGTMLEKSYKKRATTDEILRHPWLNFQKHGDIEEANDPLAMVNIELIGQQNEFSPDIYRSTSVLPFLYNYHFPHIKVTKASRDTSQSRSPKSSPTTTSQSTNEDASSSILKTNSASSTVSTFSPATSTGSTTFTDPNEIIEDHPIEWGTMEQYNLMKVPHIRANRLRRSLESVNSRRRSSSSNSYTSN